MSDIQQARTIIRVKHGKENPYVMIRRNSLQDKSLSWEARGMLGYLLSQPDDWQVDPKDLQQQCGRDKVYSILKELRDARYVKYTETRDPVTKRVTDTDYIIFEEPLPCLPETAEPDTAKPDSNTEDPESQKRESSSDSSRSSESEDSQPQNPNPSEASPKGGESDPVSPPSVVASNSVANFHNCKKHWNADTQTWDSDQYLYIGRQNAAYNLPESKWANPFFVERLGRDGAIAKYREHILSKPELLQAIPELRGKVLVCWCKPESCHGDVLAELAALPDEELPKLLPPTAINALKVMLSGELLYVTEQPEGLVNYFLVDAVTGDVINVSDADFYLLDLKHGFLDPVVEPMLITPFDAAWRINEAGIAYLRPAPPTRLAPCFHCNNAVREWTEHPGMKTIWQCNVCHALVHENILWPAQQPAPAPQPPVEKTTKPRKAKTRWYVFKMVDDQNVYLGPAPSEKAARELIADGTGTLTNQVPEGAKVLDWPKKMQPWDKLGNAIARELFGANDQAGINAVWGRIVPILHGDKRSNRCDGLIAYECERQGKDKADLDYQALADDVPVFWKDYRAANPGVTQLKDCAKVLDGWQAWRSKPQPKRINPDDYVFVEPSSYVAPGPAR